MTDRAEKVERASATLLRVTVVQTMAGGRTVRVTWKSRSAQYAYPELLRKDTLSDLEGVAEDRAAVSAAIHVLEQLHDDMIDRG